MQTVLEKLDTPREKHVSNIPLVLIHDGRGTIFQYYMLGPLYRHTYGIAYPYFDDGGMPEGGVPQIAMKYAEAIRRDIRKGPVLIGGVGWSFGGMIALEVARLLQDDARLSVVGLLMIDSYCPWSTSHRNRGRVRPSYRVTTSEKTKEKVNRCFDAAREMILSWDRPPAFSPPPTVLIRATETMPLANSPDGLQTLTDSDGKLGWSEYESFKILSVIDVPGDHFSMFADSR
ncbi:hypothetical protein LTR49_028564, partial [Elasticomyces elasticus]